MKVLYVQRSNELKPGIAMKWAMIEHLYIPTPAVPVFVNNPGQSTSTYQLRVLVETVVNFTRWRHEIDRSFIEVSKGKGEVLHTKAK